MQNKTKRINKNWIITTFIFFILLLVWLAVFVFKIILPSIADINNKKIKTKELYTSIQKVTSEWIELSDFKKIANNINWWVYIKEVVNNLEWNFFRKNFYNSWKNNYEIFIKNKKSEINSKENLAIRDILNKKIFKILPSYSENFIGVDEEYLTDYKFINYVESIIETFNLERKSGFIWINKVVLLDEFSLKKEKNKKNQILENNIFYIPLKFILNWTKEDIVNFLYYIENVWNVSILNDNIEVENNDLLIKQRNKIILEWDNNTKSYNIYEHQLISIDKIEMDDYIDSYYVLRKEWVKLGDFIKSTQWNEKIDIEITLNFYIKGLKSYKVEEIIKRFLSIYTITEQVVNANLINTKIDYSKRLEFNRINNYLLEISWDIKEMRKNIKQRKNMDEAYKKVLTYDLIFYNINLQIGLHNAVTSLIRNYNKLKIEQQAIINNKDKTELEQNKAKQLSNYLNSITKDMLTLQKNEWEDQTSYLKRINSKEVFDLVMNLNYSLNINK